MVKIEECCRRLEKSKIKDKNKKIAFNDATRVAEAIYTIASLLPEDDFKGISLFQRRNLVRSALWLCAKEGRITERSLLQALLAVREKDKGLQRKKYTFVSQISISNLTDRVVFKGDGATITINPKVGNKLNEVWREESKKASTKYGLLVPDDYAFIHLTLYENSMQMAYEKAASEIDFFRGIWNLHLNKGKIRFNYGRVVPINQLVLSPIYVVCEIQEGKVKDHLSWFEPLFTPPRSAFDTELVLRNVFNKSRLFRKALSQSKCDSIIKAALIQYATALDSVNWDFCHLKLWGLLETLVPRSNSKNVSTDVLASMLFKDQKGNKETLHGLKHNRHRIAHEGELINEEEFGVCVLKNYVEVVIDFYMSPPIEFHSQNEVSTYLETPFAKESIDNLQRKLEIRLAAQNNLERMKTNTKQIC